jgi:hypothetical protein
MRRRNLEKVSKNSKRASKVLNGLFQHGAPKILFNYHAVDCPKRVKLDFSYEFSCDDAFRVDCESIIAVCAYDLTQDALIT